MKSNFIKLMGVIALTTSVIACNKDVVTPPALPQTNTTTVAPAMASLSVGISNPLVSLKATRSSHLTATEQEKAFTEAEIFIFKTDGFLVTHNSWNNNNVVFSVPAGNYDVVAVVNGTSTIADNVTTKTQLLQKVATLAHDVTNFAMIGVLDNQSVNGASHLSVTVKRISAKVTVGKIRVDMTNPEDQAETFTVKKIKMINVVGDMSFEKALTPASVYTISTWYNKMGDENGSTTVASLIMTDELNQQITNNNEFEFNKSFYIYPNSNVNNDSYAGGQTTWSERRTRLVIFATIGSQMYAYPVTLNSVEMNKHYTFSNSGTITIKGKGIAVTDVNDKKQDTAEIDKTSISFGDTNGLVISDWEDGGELSL